MIAIQTILVTRFMTIGVEGEPAVWKPIQATVVSADPDVVLPIFKKTSHLVSAQRV